MQHALYRAAKDDPGRRFQALWDKIYRRDVLWGAQVTVYRNGGAPGIDEITLAEVEQSGIDRVLGELDGELGRPVSAVADASGAFGQYPLLSYVDHGVGVPGNRAATAEQRRLEHCH